ncbi:DUF4132 domain-containing protein [Glycomyces artemisiae]|uniref:Uncharacterized protein DUF4132 n=1 Tax=Glycomyces artemisiae TaxID=1076443 RepID=A0A2T0U9Y4_9ACTN|nr:DUF4132 domain-containing protein [Glycomyces artemisiae]PRY54755.1 uncharacterized protein DUF4132 [Glycomyces artemisiae]
MTDSENRALPDEDRFDFPASWNRFVKPRRGNGKPKKLKTDLDASLAHLADFDAVVRGHLDREDNADHRDAALAFLAGKPDLPGAAAVFGFTRRSAHSIPMLDLHRFDATAADHGLPFAAAALAELLTLDVVTDSLGEYVALLPQTFQDHRLGHVVGTKEFAAIRSHIAALPDAEYAAVIAALAALRTDPLRRFAVSLVAPDEPAWLDEVCAEHRAQKPSQYATHFLVQIITTPAQLDDLDPSLVYPRWVDTAEVADLIGRLGAAALPVLELQLTGYLDANERKTLFRALAAIPADAALDLLLDRIEDPTAMGSAMEAAARFPQRALRATAARLPGAEPEIRKRLTALLYSDPVILGPALAAQDDAVRTAIEAATGDTARLPAASADELPALLASPPWDKAADTAPPVVLKGLIPPSTNRVDWAPGEREQYASTAFGVHSSDRDWAEEAARFTEAGAFHQQRILALAPADLVPDPAAWDPAPGYVDDRLLRRILGNHGAAVAVQVARIAGSDASLRGLLLPVVNLAAARLAADALLRLKTMRPFAFAWLDRHGPDAAALLVPDALAKPKKLRAAAEAALRYLAASGQSDAVRDAAAHYGPEAAAAIAPLADADPLMPAGVPVPDPGPWVSPPALPQLLLPGRDGAAPDRALPDSTVRTAAIVLGLGSPEYDYPGVAVLAETCDRASLTRFSTALFEQWLTAGAPWEDSWALTQLAHFGDDDTVHLLAPLIGRWPGENQHHRAVKGLQVLGALGTETALRAIQSIGEKAKFAAIKEEARAQITAIAAALNLSAEQLADRLVPDYGLRDADALVLDYGPRRFKVGFDEQLKPFVTDEDGKPRKSLPKPGAKDDAVLADAAYKRFANLRKELRTVAADQVKRLERAMITGRTWTPAEFDAHFVQHPLTWHLTRRLVWTADDGSGPVAFRLAEDRSRTDVDEHALDLADTAVIRLAHPVHLGGDVAAWAEIFADYEIVQPFEQLARPVAAFTDEELATGRFTRFEGAAASVGAILGLTKKGWVRSAPLDAGVEHGIWREIPGTGYLVIALDPGIYAGSVNVHDRQILREVVLSAHDLDGWRRPVAATGVRGVDPVAASEALADLARAVEPAA